MTWRVGIDIGGTFTDVVAIEEETGRRVYEKVPSTPWDPSESFTNGLRGLKDLGVSPDGVELVMHGTTVATNAILESKYSEAGLVVARGHREVLETARQTVPGGFGNIAVWEKPPRVVPLELVREVTGRLAHNGDELVPLDADSVRAVAQQFKDMGIEAVAVSLLNSYRNPAHEQAVRDIFAEVHPGCFITLSSDLSREYREYERTLSTCLNTALMPALSRYVSQLGNAISDTGSMSQLFVMQSNGGLVHDSDIAIQPIKAVLSGPAAGVLAACTFGEAAGEPDLITLDMGGTSTDICLIEGGKPHMLAEGRIEHYNIKTPMVDITTLGAGGGSIASIVGGESLRVGPQSAGASPGPAAYGKGGTQATVTDAHVVLGRIPEASFGDGSIKVDREAARKAITENLADKLGMSAEEAALGVLRLASENMARGISLVSVARGRDPRNFTLFPFGGAGGLHAVRCAEIMQSNKVLVPVAPGLACAEGLLMTDLRADVVYTYVKREDEIDLADVQAAYRKVAAEALSAANREGFDPADTGVETFMDFRYSSQAYEIRIQLDSHFGDAELEMSESDWAAAIEEFHAAHQRTYGYSYKGQDPVELVALAAAGIGQLSRPPVTEAASKFATWEEANLGNSDVYFEAKAGHEGGFISTPVYARAGLPVGVTTAGPAIVVQEASTFVLEPGWLMSVDKTGQIHATRG
ncbi:hydantoinase/oxoprolinase family protein [Rhodococcus rhodochrous]|uniref:hydantoinase/oxoprolinase family protein n=1 Tax=Rhodococcus rhodochrous TaxID=1829 RepID=UPI0032DF6152